MIHTAELIYTLDRDSYDEIENFLRENQCKFCGNLGNSHPLQASKAEQTNGIKRFGWMISNDYNGISYFEIIKEWTGTEYRRKAIAKVHLAQLADHSKSKGDLYTDPSQLFILTKNFSDIMFAYTNNYDLSDISNWNVSRLDYAVDLLVDNDLIQPYIRLLQRGQLPAKNLTMRRWDTALGDENTTIHDENNSLRYNIYGKYWRELNKNNDPEPWRDTLRFEIEFLKDGLKEISSVRKLKTLAYDQDVLKQVKKKMKKSFESYAGSGDYYRIDSIHKNKKYFMATSPVPSKVGTEQNVEKNKERKEKEIMVLTTLANVAKKRGLWELKKQEIKKASAALKDGKKSFGINLVTLPNDFQRYSLPSLIPQFRERLKVYDRGGKLPEPETETPAEEDTSTSDPEDSGRIYFDEDNLPDDFPF